MTLGEVLEGVRLRTVLPADLAQKQISGLDYDSRRVSKDFLFFAFPGAHADGRQFAMAAMEKGAVAVVSELAPPQPFQGTWIEVEHGRHALALAARNFYGKPDERLGLTGVTGTNGKTTTAFLIDAILRASGKKTALVGTIEYRMAGEVRPAVNTTPESLDLYRIFHELEQLGGTHATMEVSSHALALGRVYGITFHTAVFTNLTRDHLDFHQTMENYFAAKRLLFAPDGAPPPRWSVINNDDPRGREIGASGEVLRYGFEPGADLKGSELEMSFEGLRFTVEQGNQKFRLESPLVGKINAYNILAACGTAISYGIDWKTIAQGIAECPPHTGPL